MGVPGRIGDEGHEGIRSVHVAPVDPANPVQLDLHVRVMIREQVVQKTTQVYKKDEAYRQIVEVMGPYPGQDAVADGVAGCLKERVGYLNPFRVHLVLGIVYVDADHILVDPQKIGHWMALANKYVRVARDL